LACDCSGAPAIGDNALGAALRQDAQAVPPELLLRPGQHRVEHRELLAESAADITVAAADAIDDIGLDNAEMRGRAVQSQPLAPRDKFLPAALKDRASLLADMEPGPHCPERLAQPCLVQARVQAGRVVPAP